MEKDNSKLHLWVLGIVVLLTRIPFLFDGFGHEEDSWGLVVNAWEMHTTGHYAASRFPGHPLQEYIYLLIWNQAAWVFNLFSAVFSVVAVVYFYKAMRKIGIDYAFETSLMLAFVPSFFIAGTYTIDFVWSLSFVMGAFYFLTNRKYLLCGILIGMAVGCRITSAVFVLPFAILLWNRMDVKQWLKNALLIGIPAALIGIAWYIPAYMQYGRAFFDYSDQFPYPPITKIAYKATIGVFGLLGLLALMYAKFKWFTRKDKSAIHIPSLVSPQRMTIAILVIIALHIISYLRLPQKSGYMLAMVPFVLMLVTMYSTRATIRITTVVFVLSSFAFSVNISDGLRGASSSSLAMNFVVSGQEIFVDPISGPIFSEQSKRQNKMNYTAKVRAAIDTTKENQQIICGWWYNEILSYYLPGRSASTAFPKNIVFYQPCEYLDSASRTGTSIYYLPEQNLYNDQMFGQNCTDSIALPYPVK